MSVSTRTTTFRASAFDIYWRITTMWLQVFLAYRGYILFIMVNSAVLLTTYWYFWKAVYANAAVIGQLSFQEMLTYVFVARSLIVLYELDLEWYISERVRTGDIVTDYIKPINYFLNCVAYSAAGALLYLFTICLPLLLGGYFIFHIKTPASPLLFLSFILSAFVSFLIGICLNFLFGILSFWVVSIERLLFAKYFAISFLAGGIIPVTYFPDWLRHLNSFLPFQHTISTPIFLYLKANTLQDALPLLGAQALWVIILIPLCLLFLRVSEAQLEIQGG